MAQSHGVDMLGLVRSLKRYALIEQLKAEAFQLGRQLEANMAKIGTGWGEREVRVCISAHVELLTTTHDLTPHERCDIRKAAAQRAGVLDF